MLTKRIIYEFDDFRVDSGQFCLNRSGGSRPITPTVFRILLVLLERAGQVATKEELMTLVWPDSFVEEGNLNRNVSTLRRALDEKPCDHRYIETIPKIGYRFVASVRSREHQPSRLTSCPAPDLGGVRIVGRDAELNTLRRTFGLAQQGRGGMTLLSGEAGMGKTALIDTFLEELQLDGQPFHLARGRCSEALVEGEPFMPWIEALARLTRDPAANPILQEAAPTWHREILHTGSGAPRKMKRELLDFCGAMNKAKPLVIVLEDFQWSDIGSVDLLASLATRLDATKTMVIASYRSAEMKVHNHPFLSVRPEVLSRIGCNETSLRLLNEKEIGRYVAMVQPGLPSPDLEIASIRAKTDGNPLFIRELLRDPEGFGETMHNIFSAKLDRLDAAHKQLLVTASVQGREFDSAVLARSLRLATGDVEEALGELDEVHGFIQRIREDELPDGKFTVRYRFAYALLQEACYASLAPTRRAALNTSLSEAILAYYGN